MGYRLPAADDGVVRTAVFHIVEQIGKVASSISRGDIWHAIRLSDFGSNVNPSAMHACPRAVGTPRPVTRYVTLAEYFWLAEQVTGVDADTLTKASRFDLADSALHAPQAGLGDVEFYPAIYDKAAVSVCRLAWDHPLPDGNKRAAWAALVMFIDLNQGT
jgi:death-on-curing protein